MGHDPRPLREALVGTEHVLAYNTSASFRSGIDALAAMLPAWVEGLAANAAAQDEAIRRAIHAAEHTPMPAVLSPAQLAALAEHRLPPGYRGDTA